MKEHRSSKRNEMMRGELTCSFEVNPLIVEKHGLLNSD